MREHWIDYRIGDLGRIVTGRTPPSSRPECFGNEYPFMTPTDMHGSKQATSTERYLSEIGAQLLSRNLIPPGSVAVSCIGWQMGKAIMTSRPSFTNQQLNTIIPNTLVDADYLYYSLSTRREELLSIGSAAGVRTPILNKSAFADLRVCLPVLSTQRNAAAILSAYDDLIENNNRRIRILEEMARLIYCEWFIGFHFPGHENCKMVDSQLGRIPESWEVKSFAEVADFINGFAFKPSHWHREGKSIVKIKELKAGVASDTPRYHGTDIPAKYHVSNGDVLFSWSADLDVYIWAGGPALLNQHLFNVVPKNDYSPLFLYNALRERMPQFRARSQGTTMRHIKRSALGEVLQSFPPSELQASYERIARPMFDSVENLCTRNSNLCLARDLLLPKLISGDLDVSELDIGIAEDIA